MSDLRLFGFFFAIGATCVALAYYIYKRFRAGSPLEEGGAPRSNVYCPDNITGSGKEGRTSPKSLCLDKSCSYVVGYYGVPALTINPKKSSVENLNANAEFFDSFIKHSKHAIPVKSTPVSVQYFGVPALKIDLNKSVEENLKNNEFLLEKIEAYRPRGIKKSSIPVPVQYFGVPALKINLNKSVEENLKSNEFTLEKIEEHRPLGIEETGKLGQPTEEEIWTEGNKKKSEKKKRKKRILKFLKRCICIKED